MPSHAFTWLFLLYFLMLDMAELSPETEPWYVFVEFSGNSHSAYLFVQAVKYFQIKLLSESKQNLISYKIRIMASICTSLFNTYN